MKQLAFALLGILTIGISIGNAAPDGLTTKAAAYSVPEISPGESFTPEASDLLAYAEATPVASDTYESPALLAQVDETGGASESTTAESPTEDSPPDPAPTEDLDELVDEAIDHAENKPEPGSSAAAWGGWIVAAVLILWRMVVYFRGKTAGT